LVSERWVEEVVMEFDRPVLAVGVARTGAPYAFALGAAILQPRSAGTARMTSKHAEGLVRRLIANEPILSFVPNGEQRIWDLDYNSPVRS
jgi:hypothetical protein